MDFYVIEWPWSRALGERWVSFPLRVQPQAPWPGLRFYPTRQEAMRR